MGLDVFNTITLEGSDEDVAALKQFVKSEMSDFDFENVIPVPEELDIGDYTKARVAKSCYRSYNSTSRPKYINDVFMNLVKIGEQVIANEEKYGVATDHDWKTKYWDTYTNAEGVEIEGDTITFWTYLKPPSPVLKKLGDLFPNVKIKDSFSSDYGVIEGSLEVN